MRLRNLPGLVAAAILVFYFLTDSGVLKVARTEQSFALFVVVLLPLAVLLGVIQLLIWTRRD